MAKFKIKRWFSRKFQNKQVRWMTIACLGLLILGCQLPAQTQNLIARDAQDLPQFLPIEASATLDNSIKIGLEVAATPEQQSLGLMHRTELGENRGMLFPFNPPRPASFWMKNTLMSLDIIFLRNQQVVTLHSNVPPCTTPQCPTYRSKGTVDQVIELEAGQAEKLGINEGDRIEVNFLQGQ